MYEIKTVEIQEALRKNMIELRKRRKMSQAVLAEAIGKSVQSINTIESGKIWPSLATIKAIAKALDVGETDLFNDPNLVSTVRFLRDNR